MTAWPVGPLDLRCELDIAGAWTDATSLVYQREGTSPPAVISRGRPDETTDQPTASSATFELNNRGGQFSPKNPLGPYYGQLGQNTLARLSIPAQNNYMRMEEPEAYAYVANDSNLAISGSIDIRIQLELADWQGCILAAKWDGGNCWAWQLNADGTLTFGWADSSAAGHLVNSTVPVPVARSAFAVRVTMNAGNGTVTFYTSSSLSGSWTQLGAAASGTSGAATSVAVSSGSPLAVGYSAAAPTANLCGRVYELQVYSGIGGTLAADGIFSSQSAGSTSWTDAQGNLWLLSGGAEISSRDYRFHGECAELPPTWDVTGADQSVQVTASGVLRRLAQGQTPAASPMRRAITLQSGTLAPVACWPCEDAAGATSFGSATNGPLMQFDGAPTLASDSSYACSSPIPQLNGSRWFGQVPAYSSNGSIVVRALVNPGTSGVNLAPIIRVITTGTCTELSARWYTGGLLGLAGYSPSSGTAVFDTGAYSFGGLPGGTIQQPLWFSLELTPGTGGTVDYALVVLPLGVETGQEITGSFAGSIGNVSAVYVNPGAAFTDWSVGQISVQSAWVSMFSLWQAFNAWEGEAAGVRFARACGENGIAARIIGPAATTALMGPQPVDTLQNILQEVEDADRGQQFETRQVFGLGYRTLASMLNQSPRATVDYSQSQAGGTSGGGTTGLKPTYDDQRLRNDWTVTRGSSSSSSSTQGAAYQYTLDDGSANSVSVIGDYADSLTANVEGDPQVPHEASWLVHAGTADEYRWPAIPFNLRRSAIQSAALYYPLLSLDVGDCLEVENIPDVVLYDPVKQLTWGLKESLGGFHHTLEVNGVPESPYEVIVLDDAVRGRCDTDGSQLAATTTPTAATLVVATTGPSGIPWTTSAADFPFDIAVGGERMTVTAIGSEGTHQVNAGDVDGTFETTASAAQWQAQGGTWARSAAEAHSGSWSAQVTASGTSAVSLLPVTASRTAVVPGWAYNVQAWMMAATAGEVTGVFVNWYTAGGGLISTSAGSTVTPAVSTWTLVQEQATAPAGAALAQLGAHMVPVAAGNACYVDDVQLQALGTQVLTVTRSVNGVSKAQAPGADVRLWTPPILSLI